MENFNLLLIITIFSAALVGSHGALTSESYWKTKLPNSPMPKAIRDLLSGQQHGTTKINFDGQLGAEVHVHNYDKISYKSQADGYVDETAVTLRAKDMHQGTNINLEFVKSTSESTFLTRQLANSIPFSSSQLHQIFTRVSVKPDSLQAKEMKVTITSCEKLAIGEAKTCANSLESMIDFTTAKLGKKVHAVSTEVEKETKLQSYRIMSIQKVGVTNEVIACHRLKYPYPVFYCHYTPNVRAYTISLMGEDGTKVKAATVCHLAVKGDPKSIPLCHLLPEDNIVWVPY